MKQTYKKKPEYLEVVKVEENKESVQDLVSFFGVQPTDVKVGYDSDWNRIIRIGDFSVHTGKLVFRDPKKGTPIAMDEEKLLQYYDLLDGQNDEKNENELKLIEE